MNRNEPRIVVRANPEGRVVLSIPSVPDTRTMPSAHARDLAEYLLEAANAADDQRLSLRAINSYRNRPNARPGKDHSAGLVRLSLGSHFMDVAPDEAMSYADKIADVVEELEARP